eukprot:4683589-Karenia_brevis.AAC.1
MPGLDVISPSAAMAMPDGKLSVTKGPAVATSSDIAHQAAPASNFNTAISEVPCGRGKLDHILSMKSRAKHEGCKSKRWGYDS